MIEPTEISVGEGKVDREETYQKMCMVLYDLYFSKIGLLDLLDKWEEILQIRSLPTKSVLTLSDVI